MIKKLLYVSQSSESKINLMLDGFSCLKGIHISKIFKLALSYDYYHNPQPVIYRLFSKFGLPIDCFSFNKRILFSCLKTDYNYVFFVKATEIFPLTLKIIKLKRPNTKIIFWSNDDMYAKHNRSIFYKYCLKYTDLVVTSKSYNSYELKALGAKKVLFQNNSFSEIQHIPYPYATKQDLSHDIIFIGTFEVERAKSIKYLAVNGFKVNVYGSGWNRLPTDLKDKNIILHYKTLTGHDYCRAIIGSKISLCFLRKINRDLQTTRSIEIPALKGFMLAERTNEHLALFKEEIEAAYFSTDHELLEKVKYYLPKDTLRKKIANAGYQRCQISKYSSKYRCDEILNFFSRN